MVISVAAISIVDAIANDLRERLFSGVLTPAAALTETDVAATYDVARPTAKAAIERLVAEGLLVRGAHKTARVADLGPDAVRDIYLARAYLESEVLRRLALARTVPGAAIRANAEIAALTDASPLAVVEPDMRFHLSLIDAVGNERISKMYRSLVGEVRLCMTRVQTLQLLDTSMIHDEHERILALLGSGEGAAAAQLLDDHLTRARERLAVVLDRTPEPDAAGAFVPGID